MTRLRFTHAAWLGALACAAFFAACSGSPAGAGPATSSCTVNDDCASGICDSGACVPAGDVGEPLPDGDQPDVDTGGEEPDAIEDAGDIGTPDDTGAGTDTTDAGPDVDEGTTGAPCTDNAACDSGYCISTSQGEVCTELCDGDCPFGWDCRLLTNSGGDVVSLCVPPQEVLCSPCTADIDCDGLQNACLQLSDGNFCGTACTLGDDACPSGYICQVERNGAGDETTQCVPELGVCGGCLDLDEDGYGVGALCLGLDCDDLDPTANPGALELCDFKDNDCDGTTDEDFDTTSDRRNCGVCGNLCTSVRATGMCVDSACEVDACEPGYYDINGDWLDGCEYACTPTVGAGEPDLCNRADDDCDGDIDEDVDFQADEANCGECGNVCDLAGADSECRAGACRIADCAAPLEDCNSLVEDGCETNLDTTLSSCGACGNACALANAIAVCTDGGCAIGSCNPGYDDCDGLAANGCEVNLNTSTLHCGTCANVCSFANGEPICSAGACRLGACDANFDNCDTNAINGCETDLRVTSSSCGSCGNTCTTANGVAACVDSACAFVECLEDFADCDLFTGNGCEVNLLSSLNHCSACGTVCRRENAAEVCDLGLCQIAACNLGYDDCDDVDANGCEIQLVNNVSHCGACGTVCSFANAVPACNGITCELAACNPGFLDCDGDPENGCEVDSRSDTNNCNGCGNECVASNGAAICRSSACVLSDCTDPFDDCDGRLDTGCESNTLVSLAHCGACGDFCSLANATEVCTAGDCEIQVCDANWGDCDGLEANGCETATVNNANACGACGNVCSFANGVPACSGTTCTLNACSDGWTNCDANPANGCEVNTASTLANCGGCGAVCNLLNASETCVSGTCTFGACAAGFADCNADLADGCEANLNTSTTHCNSCGNTCSLPNATPRCTPTGCAILSCNTGFEDCDGVAANGCEVNTQSSVNNCGGCGTVCSYTNGTPACAAGDCVLSACTGSFVNCDSNAANGCEVNAASSLANCGSCGSVCNYANAAEVCSGGSCDFQFCSLGFEDCDGALVNGCEVDIRTNINNCGSCGTLCVLPNANESCSGGNCNLNSCLSGFGNCDGNATNGCETNTTSTITACGACGTTCSVSNGTPACNSSTCAVATCNAGFGNCNNQYVDGCEVNLSNTVTSCGLCGTTCNLPNATESCIASTCAVAACEANFENCDGVAGNGCESSRLTDINNCGSCGNVCSFANASATCSSGGCALGSCSAGWTNLDGNSANGCEYQCTFQSAVDVPNTSNPADPTNADDANCDGVDGVVLTSIFVSATSGNDANNGQTAAAAVATLDRAITLARASATRKTILVANGNYSGATLTLSFSDGISLYGGYSANFSDRTNTAASYAATSAATALSITSPAAVFTIDRVNFSTTNRSAGQSTIAVTVSNALAGVVTFRRLSITPGAGGAGSNGSAGSAGATGSTGNAGSGSTGGAGGAAPGGLPGGAGGNGRFADSGLNGANGAANTASGGAGGAGNGQNLGCGDGDPQTGSGGGPGTAPASAGTSGSNGGNVGSLASLVYTPSNGTPGFLGGIGGSGGGGGAGGGERCNALFVDYRDTGRGGGGGGGGGGGAVGGSRGTGGGASIGLGLVASNVALDNVTITTGNGGQGGNGGAGGTGGTGGTGGAGALRTNNNHGSGGNGGAGGNGAAGGCGGGGGGGPSIAVWGASASTINVNGGSRTAGTGGSGGTSGCGGSAPAGLTGATRDVTVTSRL